MNDAGSLLKDLQPFTLKTGGDKGAFALDQN